MGEVTILLAYSEDDRYTVCKTSGFVNTICVFLHRYLTVLVKFLFGFKLAIRLERPLDVNQTQWTVLR